MESPSILQKYPSPAPISTIYFPWRFSLVRISKTLRLVFTWEQEDISKSCTSSISRFPGFSGNLLHLVQPQVFEERPDRPHGGDNEPLHPVEEPEAHDVPVQEGVDRTDGEVVPPCHPSLASVLLGGEPRVAGGALEVVVQVEVLDVEDVAREPPDGPGRDEPLVDVRIGPVSPPPVVQSQLAVRVERGMADPFPPESAQPGEFESGMPGEIVLPQAEDPLPHRIRDALVRIELQDPVVGRQRRGVALL